jgi:hypothetical protein
MEKNPSLQILVPFIVNRIEREYDVPEPKGFAKKNLYLMVINALNNNRWINLEFHVGSRQPETHPAEDPGLPADLEQGLHGPRPGRGAAAARELGQAAGADRGVVGGFDAATTTSST